MHQAVILSFVSNCAIPDCCKELWSIDLNRAHQRVAKHSLWQSSGEEQILLKKIYKNPQTHQVSTLDITPKQEIEDSLVEQPSSCNENLTSCMSSNWFFKVYLLSRIKEATRAYQEKESWRIELKLFQKNAYQIDQIITVGHINIPGIYNNTLRDFILLVCNEAMY